MDILMKDLLQSKFLLILSTKRNSLHLKVSWIISETTVEQIFFSIANLDHCIEPAQSTLTEKHTLKIKYMKENFREMILDKMQKDV